MGIERTNPEFGQLPESGHRYHMAAFEVEDFGDIPYGLVGKVIPPSRYVVFSCEGPKDADTGRLLREALWGELWPKVFDALKKQDIHRVADGLVIEVWHMERTLGRTELYEVWVAID